MLRCAALSLATILLVLGCDLPRDPHGTFERVEGGTLRVGLTESAPWVITQGSSPAGVEVDLMRDLADELHARIEWHLGSEARLFEQLRRGEIDAVAAGLEASTPWSQKVALTRPYLGSGRHGRVLAVRQGENRWLLTLERFLEARRAEIPLLVRREAAP